MNLLHVVHRALPPAPWSEGEKIPWQEPAFSTRMLGEHLAQTHDGASRRSERIAAHVRWIDDEVLGGRPTRVLDLACGPGLYAARLAALGHDCTGIDFAPAAIAYARTTAQDAGLRCTYQLADIRTADYGHNYGLVLLIFGELNVFRPADARAIVAKAGRALAPGGLFLLEAHTLAAVRRMGEAPPTWRTGEAGLFSARPHLRLEESFWDQDGQVASRRYLIVDAERAQVGWYAESVQAYTDVEYGALLRAGGFRLRATYPALDGSSEADEFVVFVSSAGTD
jgi:SAM-dependent methyltransferase